MEQAKTNLLADRKAKAKVFFIMEFWKPIQYKI